ncbi:MAG: LysR family transcriptional regulator [Novosphingobium sp.]|nr:LysR family transcriptional regulator [Novosphingobium sp.]
MAIELRQLGYAVVSANAQSFSRVTAALSLRQSTLSRIVLRLGEQLGVRFFECNTHEAVPSESGQAFIQQTHRIVTSDDSSVKARLGFRQSGWLPPDIYSP